MRTAFIKTLTNLAEKDERIMLLVADLGFGVVTDFMKRFPKQFVNAGVAEQDLVGIATGLALSGKIVFTYSIANFPILRCLEQLRNDVCYHKANVVSVSVGGGFCYGALGMTHHATEDIAVMRSLPEMQVIVPGDPIEAMMATKWFAQGKGPAYFRLGRAGESIVHPSPIDWEIGKAIEFQPGKDLTLIATGSMLKTAVKTALELKDMKGLDVQILSMPTVKPIDTEAILSAASTTGHIFTLEEHSIIGGLGGAVAEVLAESEIPVRRFKRFGLPSVFGKEVGDQKYLCEHYGLDASSIAKRIMDIL